MDSTPPARTLADCARSFGKLSEASFLIQIPCPVLVEIAKTELAPGETGPQAFRTEYVEASDVVPRTLSPQHREVWMVKKRENSAFSGHIGVGRTPNLDICIARSGVSKFHAYFSLREDTFLLTDKDSTNGTFVDGTRLVPGQACALRDGAKIEFANHGFTFMSPERFYKLLRSVAA